MKQNDSNAFFAVVVKKRALMRQTINEEGIYKQIKSKCCHLFQKAHD